YASKTLRAAASTRCQRPTSAGRMSRTPRTALMGDIRSCVARRAGMRREAGRLLLGHGHDDLRLTRRLHEVAETDHPREDRRLNGVLALEGAERGDATLEAGVDRLEAESRGPLEDHREESLLHQVLGDQQLLDAVAVEIDGQRRRLDLEEAAAQ